MLRDWLKVRRVHRRGRRALRALARGDLLVAEARLTDAIELSRRMWGDDANPQSIAMLSNLVDVHRYLGRVQAARELGEQVVESARQVVGEDHVITLRAMNNLALARSAAGDLSGARALHEQEVATSRRVGGPTHPETLISEANLARCLYLQGELDAAHDAWSRLVPLSEQVYGPDHPFTLVAVDELGVVTAALGDLSSAHALHQRAVDGFGRSTHWRNRPSALSAAANLAAVEARLGDPHEPCERLEGVLTTLRRTRGDDHPDTLDVLELLVDVRDRTGDTDRARRDSAELVDRSRRTLGDAHFRTTARSRRDVELAGRSSNE